MTSHLINRPAEITACSHCGQKTLTALSGGLTTAIDPSPLSIAQEIAAIITGKPTFDLIPSGRSLYVEWRDMTRVKASRLYAVAAIHTCPGATHPTQHLLAGAGSVPVPDDPPF
jgi:hypothetical protein